MSASTKRASARAESAPGFDDPPGSRPVLLLGVRARLPRILPRHSTTGPMRCRAFSRFSAGAIPPQGRPRDVVSRARSHLARVFAPRGVPPARHPRRLRARPPPPIPRQISSNIFKYLSASPRPSPPLSVAPSLTVFPRKPSRPSSITAGLYAAFVVTNGRLREWYESLAPAVVSDVIDDDFPSRDFPTTFRPTRAPRCVCALLRRPPPRVRARRVHHLRRRPRLQPQRRGLVRASIPTTTQPSGGDILRRRRAHPPRDMARGRLVRLRPGVPGRYVLLRAPRARVDFHHPGVTLARAAPARVCLCRRRARAGDDGVRSAEK